MTLMVAASPRRGCLGEMERWRLVMQLIPVTGE
jgi:hypothetical protein